MGGDELRGLLSPRRVIEVLEAAFLGASDYASPARSAVQVRDGELLVMPAVSSSAFGVKLVTLPHADRDVGVPRVKGVYVLFRGSDLRPVATFDAAPLTLLRTAGVSAIATDRLARSDARRLVLFGAGEQAREHLRFMCEIRPIEVLRVVSRAPARAQALVADARALGLDAACAEPRAVAEADIVCTCTSSATPLFDGAWLRPGTHVNAIGTYHPTARELDERTILRARVVVESRAAAFAEAGELCLPLAAGLIDASHVRADLGELLAGALVRETQEDVTVLKSVGLGLEDLAVAQAAYAARAGGP
ncbi:MAG TPA: ornithine cyclodeaminase family protein [Candidatus Limnocylindria bacterium]|nr:ornithine cyclodeaminase family protein [Candidatus Limnocylindria bacterium]